MLRIWLPKMLAAGDLERPFVTETAIRQLELMSAATIDRYLKPAKQALRLRGVPTTLAPLLRNSIGLSKAGDSPASKHCYQTKGD